MKLKDNMGISGVFKNISNEDYHSRKEFISRSAIMDFMKSPYHYWAKHINPNRPVMEQTPSMMLGSAFHAMMLEPDLFRENYTLKPQKMLLKDVGREAYEEYKLLCENLEKGNKFVLEPADYNTLVNMEAKFLLNEQALQLIRDGRIENSFFWQDEHSGLFLKARPDVLHENMIVDLKTCSDASPRAYQSEMVKYGYHVQGAMIRDAVEVIEGRRINNVINICIETKYPYAIGIYIIDEFALDEGKAKYKQACLDIKNAIVHNKYDDFGIQTISLPKWAI